MLFYSVFEGCLFCVLGMGNQGASSSSFLVFGNVCNEKRMNCLTPFALDMSPQRNIYLVLLLSVTR